LAAITIGMQGCAPRAWEELEQADSAKGTQGVLSRVEAIWFILIGLAAGWLAEQVMGVG
jgi:hypothetical protein